MMIEKLNNRRLLGRPSRRDHGPALGRQCLCARRRQTAGRPTSGGDLRLWTSASRKQVLPVLEEHGGCCSIEPIELGAVAAT